MSEVQLSKLGKLPVEILQIILGHVEKRHDLAKLSRASSWLHSNVEDLIYSGDLTSKFTAAHLIRTLIMKPHLGNRFKSLMLEKPDDWFSGEDIPVLERVDLTPFSHDNWAVLEGLGWKEFIVREDNWSLVMALLIWLLPNLEHLHIGYHSDLQADFANTMGSGTRLTKLKSLIHHANDSTLELEELDYLLVLPSLITVTVDYISWGPRWEHLDSPLAIQHLTLTFCAAQRADLKNLLSSCPDLRTLSLQYGNFESKIWDHFPIEGIVEGLWEVRDQLEEFTLTEAYCGWAENGAFKTLSLNHLTKLRVMEIQTRRFFNRNVETEIIPRRFNFSDLPPALEKLTLRATFDRVGIAMDQVKNDLEDNLKWLELGELKELKEVHVRFVHRGVERKDRIWPRLGRLYRKFGIVLSFDFEGNEWSDQERIVFSDEDDLVEDGERVVVDGGEELWDTPSASSQTGDLSW